MQEQVDQGLFAVSQISGRGQIAINHLPGLFTIERIGDALLQRVECGLHYLKIV